MDHLTNEDRFLLSEFKKILRRNKDQDFLNLDESFKHKFDFQIHRIEDILTNTNRIIPPNRWSYHRIIFVKEGTGEFITGIYRFKAIRNTLVVIPAKVTTSSRNWSEESDAYVVLFNAEYFLQNNFPSKFLENKKILNSGINPFVYLTEDQGVEITCIFEKILYEKANGDRDKDELISLKILELLILSERYFAKRLQFEGNQSPARDVIRTFIHLLEDNYIREHSVKFYAEKLAIHPNYLNALIKRHTGLSAKESIQNKILLETKYLLNSTKLTVKEISSLLGFRDPNYFTVFFKQLEKVSPVHYRSSHS